MIFFLFFFSTAARTPTTRARPHTCTLHESHSAFFFCAPIVLLNIAFGITVIVFNFVVFLFVFFFFFLVLRPFCFYFYFVAPFRTLSLRYFRKLCICCFTAGGVCYSVI